MAALHPRILSGGQSDFEKEHIGLGEFFFRQANKYAEKILQVIFKLKWFNLFLKYLYYIFNVVNNCRILKTPYLLLYST